MSDDHLIGDQRATQAVSANASRLPLVEPVEQTCGARPALVSADSDFFSVKNLNALEQRGIEGYVPDAHFGGAQQGSCKTFD